MRIRKHNNKNEYIRTPDRVWVRNFTKKSTRSIDINQLTPVKERQLLLANEFENSKKKFPGIEEQPVSHRDVVIVSDGLGFDEKQWILSEMPSAAIIGVNGSLPKWSLVGKKCPEEKRRSMYYVVNNPYEECMKYFPRNHSFFPTCIASSRTFPKFLDQYLGQVYRYYPTPEESFSGDAMGVNYTVDDYRNSICAAVFLAYKFNARKILLMCCDDAFEDERPASVSTGKDTWNYPQQVISHNIIDAYFFWLKKLDYNIEIMDYSSGPYYNNATYIQDRTEAIGFFKNDE